MSILARNTAAVLPLKHAAADFGVAAEPEATDDTTQIPVARVGDQTISLLLEDELRVVKGVTSSTWLKALPGRNRLGRPLRRRDGGVDSRQPDYLPGLDRAAAPASGRCGADRVDLDCNDASGAGTPWHHPGPRGDRC